MIWLHIIIELFIQLKCSSVREALGEYPTTDPFISSTQPNIITGNLDEGLCKAHCDYSNNCKKSCMRIENKIIF